jgi:GNAT superfamily N-acetyltransferase
MTARLLPGTALRVRRGRRTDLPQMQAVLGVPPADRPLGLYRRLLADLGTDVYVAEDEGGEIVGVVSMVYARSLVRGGVSALLDGARARHPPARPLLEQLVAFAEERARRRGCRRLAAWVEAGDEELRAALLARGYRPGALLVTELVAGGEG